VPLLSVSADFYVRLFVQIFSSRLSSKKSASRTGSIYHCQGCNSITVQPLGKCIIADGKETYSVALGTAVGKVCEFCSHHFQVGGPIWIDPIHSSDFVDHLKKEISLHAEEYGTSKRLAGMLQVISEEVPDVVLFRTIDDLSRNVRCASPSMEMIRSALLNAGYRVSYSHCHRTSVKTDAPNSFIWDMMRKWVEMHPVNPDRISAAGKRILSQSCSQEISFDIRGDAIPFSKKHEMTRFQVNPEPNWGPKPRPEKNATPVSETTATKKFKIDVTE
jgi:tRNA (guanine26-N2/guanine27-N2)-dimethyltransferase